MSFLLVTIPFIRNQAWLLTSFDWDLQRLGLQSKENAIIIIIVSHPVATVDQRPSQIALTHSDHLQLDTNSQEALNFVSPSNFLPASVTFESEGSPPGDGTRLPIVWHPCYVNTANWWKDMYMYIYIFHALSKFHCLLHELYLANHHSSLEHAICGTSCLLLAFLNLTTCHLSNPRSINLIWSLSPLYPLSLLLSSFFLRWGFV